MCLYAGNHKEILWTSRQHMAFAKAKCLCVISQIAHKFLHVSSGSLIAWERSEEAQINCQVRGKVVSESIYSNIFPSSLCPLPKSSDPQIINAWVHSPTSASLMHIGTILNCVLSHMRNQEPGGFEQPLSVWQNRGCAVGFLLSVRFVSSPFAEMQIISIFIIGMTL